MKKLIHETITILILVLAMYLIGSSDPLRDNKTVPYYAQESFERQRQNLIPGKKKLEEYKSSENKSGKKKENKNGNEEKKSIKKEKLSNTILLSEKKENKEIKNNNENLSNNEYSIKINVDGLVIDINTASIDELLKIKGIGESTAKKIIEFREKNGPFSSIDHLKSVKGIGEKKLAKLKKLMVEH